MENGIRKPVASGKFYPENKIELKNLIEQLLKDIPKIKNNNSLQALIVPHAGYIYSGRTAAKGFAQLTNMIKHFVIIGPSHYASFEGLAGSSAKYWETPLGQVKQTASNLFQINNQAHYPEHSIEVELPFLQYINRNEYVDVTCLLAGQIVDPIKTAKELLNNNEESIFIISSDLSHFLKETEAEVIDHKTIDAILNLDGNYFKDWENKACGATGIRIAIEMAKIKSWFPKLIDYTTSAETSGSKSSVVGYTSIGFFNRYV